MAELNVLGLTVDERHFLPLGVFYWINRIRGLAFSGTDATVFSLFESYVRNPTNGRFFRCCLPQSQAESEKHIGTAML